MAAPPTNTSQVMDSRSRAFSNVTFLKNLELSRRDYTIKVRIIRLWKQPMYNDPEQWYSIEMILVDEEGTTMQANVLRRWFPQFEQLFNESDCYFIVKPTIGLNESKYKYVDNQNKIGIYCDTKVYPCYDFSGPKYGFAFTSFDRIAEKQIHENHPLDVIGFVADVKDLKKFKTLKGKDTKKVNVVLQDLNMETIYLSLWDSYADRIIEFWEKREEHGVIVVILQFGTLKYFGKSVFVNNAFNVSKLFINSENDEIITFRNRLVQKSAVFSCSSQSSKLSGMFLSMYNEYVVKTEFNNIAELNLKMVKSVVIVGTIRIIPQEIPWYYLACKACNKKVNKKSDQNEVSHAELVPQEVVYECKTDTCSDGIIQTLQRLKIPLTVQDSTGTVSLTLFDREATKILNKSASMLIEKHLNGGDKSLYPDEFETLLEKKFAFKIEIKQFNLDNNFWVFGISKLTDDIDIIYELEKKANNVDVDNSDSLTNQFNAIQLEEIVTLKDQNSESFTIGLNDSQSTDTVSFKVAVETMDDNVTPFSKDINDKGIGKRHLVEEATFKRKSKNPQFKRKLVESFDVEEVGELSATKAVCDGKKKLLTPKIEK